MAAARDISVGSRHHRLTVLDANFRRVSSGGAYFRCRCDCGVEREFLFRGSFSSKSCGCLQKEVAASGKRTHGDAREPLYLAWAGFRARCANPNRKEYANYGGRGITVHSDWQDYLVFREWALAAGYEHGLDLDRIDNDGPYSPENCRWVTRSSNLRNTRRNRWLTAFGETKTMKDWSEDERCAVTYQTLETRLRRNPGLDVEDAISLSTLRGMKMAKD